MPVQVSTHLRSDPGDAAPLPCPVQTWLTALRAPSQTIDEIEAIVLSHGNNVHGINLRIKAQAFGVPWAAGQDQTHYKGYIDRRDRVQSDAFFIKWEGFARCRKNRIQDYAVDDDGEDLELELLPFDDGRPAPTLKEETDEEPEAEAADDDGPPGAEDEVEEDEDDAVEVEVHGQTWTKRIPAYVSVDARTQPRTKPSLNGGDVKPKGINELFHYFMPESFVSTTLRYTNLKLSGVTADTKPLTKGELLQFYGYCIALSVHTGTTLDKMWSLTGEPDSIVPPPAMGRHGISLHRFKKIRSVISFGPSDETSLRSDPWAFIRPVVDDFNTHMHDAFNPGWLLTCDESMIAWRGAVGLLDPKKIPFRSWVPRKPEPVGAELKDIGCALSGLILGIEICEGKERHKAQEWCDVLGHTAATTMRLSKPWFGT